MKIDSIINAVKEIQKFYESELPCYEDVKKLAEYCIHLCNYFIVSNTPANGSLTGNGLEAFLKAAKNSPPAEVKEAVVNIVKTLFKEYIPTEATALTTPLYQSPKKETLESVVTETPQPPKEKESPAQPDPQTELKAKRKKRSAEELEKINNDILVYLKPTPKSVKEIITYLNENKYGLTYQDVWSRCNKLAASGVVELISDNGKPKYKIVVKGEETQPPLTAKA